MTTIEQTQTLVIAINAILSEAQDRYIRAQVARHEYAWQADKTDEESIAMLAANKHKIIAVPKSKYVNIDRIDATRAGMAYGSGLFMVDKTSGAIFGIKAYGKIHRGHYYGTVDAPDLRAVCMAAAVLERGEVAKILSAQTTAAA
jgi:hypothetical protein